MPMGLGLARRRREIYRDRPSDKSKTYRMSSLWNVFLSVFSKQGSGLVTKARLGGERVYKVLSAPERESVVYWYSI